MSPHQIAPRTMSASKKTAKTLTAEHKAKIGTAMRQMYSERPEVRRAKADYMRAVHAAAKREAARKTRSE